MTDEVNSKPDPAPFDTPEFKAAVEAQVKAFLDANLPDLVAAAMPETPEQKAEREARERAQARADVEAAKAAENKARAKEEADKAKKARKAREAAKKGAAAMLQADNAVAAAQPRNAVDYTKLIDAEREYVIFADNGDEYCIDFNIKIDPSLHLDIAKERGVTVKIPLSATDLPERFEFARLTLREAEKDSPVILRCEMVQPFWVGEGRRADWPAGSLLFRVIG